MSESISQCREPLCSMLATLHSWVTSTYPDTVVVETDSIDREGWIDYAAPVGEGSEVVFAGIRFRRNKPAGMTVVLAARPERDQEEWVHEDVGKIRPLGFAFGLPRPFQKSMSEEEWRYAFDLVSQARAAVARL